MSRNKKHTGKRTARINGSDERSVPMIHPSEEQRMDEARRRAFNEYLDEVLPPISSGIHPFRRFQPAEIVYDERNGYGIVTGFNMMDDAREFSGLGVQFVREGRMTVHLIYTPKESLILKPSGVVFEVRKHQGLTLEDVLKIEGKHGYETGKETAE